MRRKRAPSRIASQLQALQKVGGIVKALRPPKKPKPVLPPPPSTCPPEPTRAPKVKRPPSLNIEIVDAAKAAHFPPTVEYEYETKIDGQGQTTRKLVVGHDGQPVKKVAPVVAPAPEKPVEPDRPKTRVEQMRERYLEHHSGATPAAGGFSDPWGIVSRNISREGGDDSWTRRLRLQDF
jgi:hypothetical protein